MVLDKLPISRIVLTALFALFVARRLNLTLLFSFDVIFRNTNSRTMVLHCINVVNGVEIKLPLLYLSDIFLHADIPPCAIIFS